MSVDHTFIVLDTSGQLEAISQALLDFTNPFLVICAEPPKLVTLPVTLESGMVGQVSTYRGGDVQVSVDGIPTPICNRRCQQILMALLFEAMTQGVNYMETAEPDIAVASAMFDTTRPERHHIAALDLFFSHPRIDVLLNDIMGYMSVVRDNPWRDWQLMESNGFYVLLGGRDYRVLEWERMTKVPKENGTSHEFDMNSLIQFISTQHGQQLGRCYPPLSTIRGMIYDTLVQLLPNINVNSTTPVYTRLDPAYQQFIHNTVKPALGVFVRTFILPITTPDGHRLHHIKYSGDILDNGVFVLVEHHPTASDEDIERQEILRAIENQDFVPERLRRKYNL